MNFLTGRPFIIDKAVPDIKPEAEFSRSVTHFTTVLFPMALLLNLSMI